MGLILSSEHWHWCSLQETLVGSSSGTSLRQAGIVPGLRLVLA